MCRAIVFDLDGTIVDDIEEHIEAWRRAMEDLGKKVTEREIEIYRENVGKTLYDIMKAIYGEVEREFFERVKKEKTRHFKELIARTRPIIPREILESLKGKYKLVLFTSTTREIAEAILRTHNLIHLFDEMVTADDVKRPKPDPEGLFKAREKTGCEVVAFIGDTKYDEEAARRAGIRFIHIEEFLRSWRSLL